MCVATVYAYSIITDALQLWILIHCEQNLLSGNRLERNRWALIYAISSDLSLLSAQCWFNCGSFWQQSWYFITAPNLIRHGPTASYLTKMNYVHLLRCITQAIKMSPWTPWSSTAWLQDRCSTSTVLQRSRLCSRHRQALEPKRRRTLMYRAWKGCGSWGIINREPGQLPTEPTVLCASLQKTRYQSSSRESTTSITAFVSELNLAKVLSNYFAYKIYWRSHTYL